MLLTRRYHAANQAVHVLTRRYRVANQAEQRVNLAVSMLTRQYNVLTRHSTHWNQATGRVPGIVLTGTRQQAEYQA